MRSHTCLAPLQDILNTLSYAIMWRFAETQMSVGRPIIVDCPLARRELYDAGAALANKVCYAIEFLTHGV